MTDRPFETASLEGIERSGGRPEWVPIRRRFGIASFGVNAWSGEAGATLVPEHDEKSTGHEELYLVTAGHATFTVAGETVEAPTGTLVFVGEPGTSRGAVAGPTGATIVSMGGKPGEAFEENPWEVNSEVYPLFDRGEHEQAKRLLEEALDEHPGAGGLLYNLACAEAQLGDRETAIAHLLQAVEIEHDFARYAREDDDLAALRDDPRFPAAPA